MKATMSRQRPLLVVLLLLTLLALAACGGDAEEPVEEPLPAPTGEVVEEPAEEPAGENGMAGEGMLPPVNPLEVEGNIITAGSSTVFPLAEVMAERFTEEGYGGQITIDSIGSGAGFERFCVSAEIDVSNASRAINEGEVAACQENGREPLEFRVGTDALAIVVNPENPVENLTLEQLAQLYSGEVARWSDLGVEYDVPVQLYSPGTDSGTFDYFVEEVFDEDEEPILSAGDIQFSEDDNVLVQGVEGSPGGIGYFGYAYYIENADRLKIVNIEGIEPTAESAESGEYPLARPLFIYSAASVMAEKPQVAAYINFFLTYVNEEVVGVGYFPASDEALNEARELLAGNMQ